MINESDGPQDSQEDQNIQDSPVDPITGQFEGLIGGAIEKAVSQYKNLLLQGLETEVKRIVTEFEDATVDLDAEVAKQTRARLSELVEGEVRSVFDDTLGEAEETLADPIWRKARDLHIPYLAAKKPDEDASMPQRPEQPDSVAAHDSVTQPEVPETNQEDGSVPKSIAAPSPNFWVFPPDQQMRVRVQEEPDEEYPSADTFAVSQEQTDDNETYGDALSAVIEDNSDLETVIHDNADLVHLAPNESPEQEPADSFDSGLMGEIDDEELLVADAMEFDDFEEPYIDLPDSPFEASDDWNTSESAIREETTEAVEYVAAESEEAIAEYPEEMQEEAAEFQVDDPEAVSPVAVEPEEEESAPLAEQIVAEEEESAPLTEQIVDEDHTENTANENAAQDDVAADQNEVVTSVAEEPTLAVDEREKVISNVEGDVEAVAEQSRDLITNDAPSEGAESHEPSEPNTVQPDEFEGTVRLNVEAPGCVKEIVQFVRELRQKPQLRLLRLVGNNRDGVDIWLGLREPLKLGTILPEMQGVTIISKPLEHVGDADERLLSVRLIREEAPQNLEALAPSDSIPVDKSRVVA